MDNKLYKSLYTTRVFETHNHSCLIKGQKTRVYIALRLRVLLKITLKSSIIRMKTSSNLSHFTRRNGLFYEHKCMIKQRKMMQITTRNAFFYPINTIKSWYRCCFLAFIFLFASFLKSTFLANKHNKNKQILSLLYALFSLKNKVF